MPWKESSAACELIEMWLESVSGISRVTGHKCQPVLGV